MHISIETAKLPLKIYPDGSVCLTLRPPLPSSLIGILTYLYALFIEIDVLIFWTEYRQYQAWSQEEQGNCRLASKIGVVQAV